MADEEDCDDDSKCTDNGICSFGKCQCTGTYLHIGVCYILYVPSICTVYMQVYIQTNRGIICNLVFAVVTSHMNLCGLFNLSTKNGLVGTYLVTSNKVYQSVLKMLKFEKVTWAGPNCTTHNHLYFHSFSLVFYGLMTVSFIQLFFCIRKDTQINRFHLKGRGSAQPIKSEISPQLSISYQS